MYILNNLFHFILLQLSPKTKLTFNYCFHIFQFIILRYYHHRKLGIKLNKISSVSTFETYRYLHTTRDRLFYSIICVYTAAYVNQQT